MLAFPIQASHACVASHIGSTWLYCKVLKVVAGPITAETFEQTLGLFQFGKELNSLATILTDSNAIHEALNLPFAHRLV